MRTTLCAAALVGWAALAATGCDESLSQLAGPSPALEPTFSTIQSNIFEAPDAAGRAACVTCHTNAVHAPSGGLNLLHDAAYDQLVNVPSHEKPALRRVVPGDPDSSYIVHKLEGRPGIIGRQMPYSGPPYLTSGQLVIIRRWIEIGAPRN